MQESPQSLLARRGRSAMALGAVVLLVSTLLYYALGLVTGMNAGYGKELLSLEDDRWELSESLYAAAITITTVGYGDVLGTDQLEVWQDGEGRYRFVSPTDPHEDPGFDPRTAELVRDWSPVTRLTSAFLAIVGIAFFLDVTAQVTSFFVEGAYEDMRVARRSKRRLAALSNHVIVCGAGQHGLHVVEALRETRIPCAVIEQDEDSADLLRDAFPDVPVLEGDATEESSLNQAGLAASRGLICVLGEDGMNAVAAVTARQLQPGIRVVSRGFGRVSARRLTAAGCGVVLSGRLAAMRMASEMARPTAVEFLDLVLGPKDDEALRLEDVRVGERFAGHRLEESDGLGIVPLALRHPDETTTIYNPHDDERFDEGDVLTVIGTRVQLAQLDQMLGAQAETPPEALLELAVLDTPHPRTESPAPSPGQLRDHFVVCGGGETGTWIAREFHATDRACVLVDRDAAALESLRREMPSLSTVLGDAEDPEVLAEAGVANARALAACLPSDRLNLLTVVTAQQANADLRTVSLVFDEASERRLRRAGAQVVSKGRIGGRRLSAGLLRPQLTGFLDRMLSDPRGVRVESARVVEGSPAAGHSLRELDFWEATGVRPVAVIPPVAHCDAAIFDPEPHVVLEPDARVIVLASPEELQRVVALVGAYE